MKEGAKRIIWIMDILIEERARMTNERKPDLIDIRRVGNLEQQMLKSEKRRVKSYY